MLKDLVLDHVAIAVNDLKKSMAFYEKIGLEFDEKIETIEEQKVKAAFAKVDQNAKLELLEATSEDSTIDKYLKNNKGRDGIHHICFKVQDIALKVKELKEQGVIFIYDEPQAGAHNTLVNFIHPKSSGGVLVELAQKL